MGRGLKKGYTMDETTTTDAPVETGGQHIDGVAIDDQGMAIPQPENTEQAEAVAQTTEPEAQKPQTDSKPSQDDELATWAENKGLQLDSDNAIKAAKMARESERAMHAKAQQKSELEKSLQTSSDEYAEDMALNTGQDPELLKRLQRVEVRDSVRDFYDTHPDAREIEQDMVAELQRRPHLAGDLEALYAVVKTRDLNAVKSQGKREALETLAHKQQAAVPRGNAVNTSGMGAESITPQNVDKLVGQNSYEWYVQNRDSINRAMAG
jgi:hypothetical protein